MTRRLPKENSCNWPSLCAVVLGFFLITISLEAQNSRENSFEQVKREFIVEFKPGILTLPQGRTKGRLDEIEIPSQELHQILVNGRVSEISRLIPNFVAENRFKMTRTGEPVELTDWSNVYLLRLAVPMMRDSLLNTMSS